MKESIFLNDALKLMDRQVFDITFCTADRARKKGGVITTLENCKMKARTEEMMKKGVLDLVTPSKGHFVRVHNILITHVNGLIVV